MKKGTIIDGVVEQVDFPNKGRVVTEEGKVLVKGVLPGQQVRMRITKSRNQRYEGNLLEVLKKGEIETCEPVCPQFGMCGGCAYQTIPYEEQLKLKEEQVRRLIREVYEDEEDRFEGSSASPVTQEYRNKMEYSFGDEFKDGPLSLGMHKKGSFYDILTVDQCRLVHPDYNKVLRYTLDYFKKKEITFYHKMTREGYLRHMLLRRSSNPEEMLISIITTSNLPIDLTEWKDGLFELGLSATIAGVLHIKNDGLADVVKCDEMDILYGRDYIQETLLGLKFKVSVFSFFQTNTKGAEVLYRIVRNYVEEGRQDVVYDLYSGTGTIAQVIAPVAKKVIGVEIVEDAVLAARENAKLNGLDSCEFLAGDVLQVLDEIETKPDLIILDPPRDGIHPKALKKIIAYGVERMIYISCKPTSLARDLAILKENGYEMVKYQVVDQFPGTGHVETVCLLSNRKADSHIKLSLDMDEYYDIIEKEQAEKK